MARPADQGVDHTVGGIAAEEGATPDDSSDAAAPELSVVVPTYDEAANVPVLIERLQSALDGIAHEIVVVDDDSPDGTWRVVEEIGTRLPHVRVIRRIGAKGLSGAVVTGLHAARGRCVAVMDADGQHDETILPDMLERVRGGDEVCVGSREAAGGSYGTFSRKRLLMSRGARWLAGRMLGESVGDPMSGYFAMSREFMLRTIGEVNPQGFKILLEFIARGRPGRVSEVGYTFRDRLHGATKLNATVALEYLLALVDLRFGWLVPNQFVKFGLVGLTGSLVNFAGFAAAQAAGAPIPLAVLVGVELAILWTYTANNFFTFTPMSFRGRDFVLGLALYQLVCCYGLVVQLSVVQTLLSSFPVLSTNLGTLYLAYLAGVVFAAVGNYFLHSYYTWNRLGFAVARPRGPAVTAVAR